MKHGILLFPRSEKWRPKCFLQKNIRETQIIYVSLFHIHNVLVV